MRARTAPAPAPTATKPAPPPTHLLDQKSLASTLPLGGAADNPASYASLVDAIVRAQAATDKREILKQKFVLYARDGTAAALRPLA